MLWRGELLHYGEHELQRFGLEGRLIRFRGENAEQFQILAGLYVRPHAQLAQQALEAVQPGRHGVQIGRQVER